MMEIFRFSDLCLFIISMTHLENAEEFTQAIIWWLWHRNTDSAVHLRGMVPCLSSSTLDLRSCSLNWRTGNPERGTKASLQVLLLNTVWSQIDGYFIEGFIERCYKPIWLLQNCRDPALEGRESMVWNATEGRGGHWNRHTTASCFKSFIEKQHAHVATFRALALHKQASQWEIKARARRAHACGAPPPAGVRAFCGSWETRKHFWVLSSAVTPAGAARAATSQNKIGCNRICSCNVNAALNARASVRVVKSH